MNRKRLTTIVVCVSMIILLVVGAVWTYLVTSYESDLGTSNTVVVSSSESPVDGSDDNLLLELSFADDAEDLLWSSLEIELEIEGSAHTCSFGVQSKSNQSDSFWVLLQTEIGSGQEAYTYVIPT